jgi:hypothetical protein
MTDPRDVPALDQVLMLGDPAPTGAYRVDVATQRWWWSDETYRIHGFEPGDVVPTTALVLAHQHPQDRVRRVLDVPALPGDGPFGSVHRILDARGDERLVCVVGEVRSGDHGPEITGTVADLTTSVSRRAAQQADAEIRTAARSRRDIEQAKAVISLVLDVDDDDAFAVLREYSNRSNVAVRELSRRVLERSRAAWRQGDLEPTSLLTGLGDPATDVLDDQMQR